MPHKIIFRVLSCKVFVCVRSTLAAPSYRAQPLLTVSLVLYNQSFHPHSSPNVHPSLYLPLSFSLAVPQGFSTAYCGPRVRTQRDIRNCFSFVNEEDECGCWMIVGCQMYNINLGERKQTHTSSRGPFKRNLVCVIYAIPPVGSPKFAPKKGKQKVIPPVGSPKRRG